MGQNTMPQPCERNMLHQLSGKRDRKTGQGRQPRNTLMSRQLQKDANDNAKRRLSTGERRRLVLQ